MLLLLFPLSSGSFLEYKRESYQGHIQRGHAPLSLQSSIEWLFYRKKTALLVLFSLPEVFCGPQILVCQKCVRPRPCWGSSRRSPDPIVGCGGGHPLLIATLLGSKVSAPRLQWPPPSVKSWLRPWKLSALFCVILCIDVSTHKHTRVSSLCLKLVFRLCVSTSICAYVFACVLDCGQFISYVCFCVWSLGGCVLLLVSVACKDFVSAMNRYGPTVTLNTALLF